MAFRQGRFIPKHPEKYVGKNINSIRFMSSWELSLMTFLDTGNKNAICWSSESIKIPYIKPTDGKLHHYWPDIYLKVRTKDNTIKEFIIEIKPECQLKPSTARRHKTRLLENATFAINCAKWQACQKFCDTQGFIFLRLTEKQLFGTFK